MTLYHITTIAGKFVQTPLEKVPAAVLHSATQLRQYLQTHAVRRIGGREGRDWRISAAGRSTCLIPIHVSATDDSCSLVIQ